MKQFVLALAITGALALAVAATAVAGYHDSRGACSYANGVVTGTGMPTHKYIWLYAEPNNDPAQYVLVDDGLVVVDGTTSTPYTATVPTTFGFYVVNGGSYVEVAECSS